MAKMVTLINIEKDTKELGTVNGRRIVLGSSLDSGNDDLRIARPEVSLTQIEFSELKKIPAVEQALDFWTKANPPKVMIRS